MMRKQAFAALAVAALASAGLSAQAARPADPPLKVIHGNASIPFMNVRNTITTWTWLQDGSLLLETPFHYYRAQVMQPCGSPIDRTERLGFKANPGGDFDRFSSVVVGHQECPVTSLDEVAKPNWRRS